MFALARFSCKIIRLIWFGLILIGLARSHLPWFLVWNGICSRREVQVIWAGLVAFNSICQVLAYSLYALVVSITVYFHPISDLRQLLVDIFQFQSCRGVSDYLGLILMETFWVIEFLGEIKRGRCILTDSSFISPLTLIALLFTYLVHVFLEREIDRSKFFLMYCWIAVSTDDLLHIMFLIGFFVSKALGCYLR